LPRGGALLALLLFGAGCATAPRSTPPAPPAAPATAAAARPNIILILTDDMDVSHVQYMPQLRRHISDRGVRFTNSFAVGPVCAPSRASILTGQYLHNHGLITNKPPRGSFRKFTSEGREASTVATWLRNAGYRTGLIGKYINFYPMRNQNAAYVPPGWDDWRGVFFPESYYEYQVNENGRLVDYGKEEQDYLTDVMREKALDFIARTPAGQPFFLYLSPFAPHGPAWVADRHESLFPDLKAPRPPSYNEEDVSDKPAWLRQLPRMTPEMEKATDELFRARVLTLQAVDEMIDALVGALEKRGALQNTFLFFTSDNGFHFGEHRIDHGKGDAYEESIRIPLLVRGPGVPAGQALEQFALNIDLAPTFAALAGLEPPESADGRSLARLLQGRAVLRDWRSDFLIEQYADTGRARADADNDKESGAITDYAALRTQQHLYVEYATGERELYDLKSDPSQLDSLHASADPQLVAGLKARLQALRECRGETCRQ
jgi:arylsulfatase A-like enzyme